MENSHSDIEYGKHWPILDLDLDFDLQSCALISNCHSTPILWYPMCICSWNVVTWCIEVSQKIWLIMVLVPTAGSLQKHVNVYNMYLSNVYLYIYIYILNQSWHSNLDLFWVYIWVPVNDAHHTLVRSCQVGPSLYILTSVKWIVRAVLREHFGLHLRCAIAAGREGRGPGSQAGPWVIKRLDNGGRDQH